MINLNGNKPYLKKLNLILSQNLDFVENKKVHSIHSIHSFPAKFPPQLPSYFIDLLTEPGDTVLDPMAGSGTTISESVLSNRNTIGFDIDPLAILMNQVKISVPDKQQQLALVHDIASKAKKIFENNSELLSNFFNTLDEETFKFIQYWFDPTTQKQLAALVITIKEVPDENSFNLLKLIFSSIIITKNGGVSLAFDLAHTRPHRAKIAYDMNNKIILGEKIAKNPGKRDKLLTKKIKPVFFEFEKKAKTIINNLFDDQYSASAFINFGNAQELTLLDHSVDLIVTSPPYASNAIDYMRAHKFFLVWWGFNVNNLSKLRREYIGGESIQQFELIPLPEKTMDVIMKISEADKKKGKSIHRYYSEMMLVLREMYRVLRPGKTAIFVVGDSLIRNISVEIDRCLVEIGQEIGFVIPKIGIRNINRDKRMMPATQNGNSKSQIEQRMYHEYVIAFYKPI